MGLVTVAIVMAGIVVIGIVLLALRWRLGSSEGQALRHYQNALDTLRTVSDRMESSRPAVVPRSQSEPPPDETRSTGKASTAAWTSGSRASSGVRSTNPRAEKTADEAVTSGQRPRSVVSQTPASALDDREPYGLAALHRVSDKARASSSSDASVLPPETTRRERNGVSVNRVQSDNSPFVFEGEDLEPEPTGGLTPIVQPRASRRALQRSARPPSRVPAALAALFSIVVIAVVVVLVVGSLHHNHASTTRPPTHPKTTTPPKSHTTSTTAATTTTTTALPGVQPEAGSGTTQGATYAAPSSSYTVVLTSSGACWVYATEAATGSVVWTGTLDQGQAQTLTTTGELDVELGHANTITATLNGVPVQYPPSYQAVFTMKFLPTTT